MAQYLPLPSIGRPRPRNLRLADLYLRQGEQIADAELRSGAIKAQLFGDIGRTVGQTASSIIQAPQMAREQATREAAQAQQLKAGAMQLGEAERQVNERENFGMAMSAGSRQKTLDALKDRPELYEKAQGHFSRIDTSMKQLLGDTAAGIADFGYTPEAAMAAMDDLLDQGFDEKKIEPFRAAIQRDPSVVKQLVDSLLTQSPDPRHQAMARPPVDELVNVPAGGSVFNKRTGEPVFTAPEKTPAPEKPPAVGSFEDYMLTAYGERPTPEQIRQGRKEYNQSDDRPININTGQPRPLTQTAEAQIINRLANQWITASKPIKELERQVALMDTGMKAVDRGDLAQGAQMVLVTFQKILDPPSVVRESEFMRSASGQSLVNRVKGAVEKLQKGGAGIGAPELQKFAALAREATDAQRTASGLDRIKSRLSKTAARYAIPEELIFEDAPSATAPAGDTALPGDVEYGLDGKPIKKKP